MVGVSKNNKKIKLQWKITAKSFFHLFCYLQVYLPVVRPCLFWINLLVFGPTVPIPYSQYTLFPHPEFLQMKGEGLGEPAIYHWIPWSFSWLKTLGSLGQMVMVQMQVSSRISQMHLGYTGQVQQAQRTHAGTQGPDSVNCILPKPKQTASRGTWPVVWSKVIPGSSQRWRWERLA